MKVIETRKTLNGECNAWGQGTPCFLIRFAGCNLCCSYCDAQAAQDPDTLNATELQATEIVDMILENTPQNGIVLITGGEPLLQDHGKLNVILTHPQLTDRGFVVETNGTIGSEFNFLKGNISWVIDCKLPSSGIVCDWDKPWTYVPKTFDSLALRSERDFIKFVVDTSKETSYKEDMRCVDLMASYLDSHGCVARLIISPVTNSQGSGTHPSTTKHLVSWLHKMQQQGITIAVQAQLHKLLGIA
jgi:7-carboxy-7-deazaguanine synthase